MKFYGSVGFWEQNVEVKPGVYKPTIVEKPYSGDVNWHNRHFQNSENQNDDIKLNNQISIISDLYSQQNFSSIRYVVWYDVKWKVTNVEVNYPRLVLTIGGVYNGTGAEKTSSTSKTL